jgi:hypothetical protein
MMPDAGESAGGQSLFSADEQADEQDAEKSAWQSIEALPRRLATFLRSADAGFGDDAAVQAAVDAGRVQLNGASVGSIDDGVYVFDTVQLDGAPCELNLEGRPRNVFAYHKPHGMECTVAVAAPRGLQGVAASFEHSGAALHAVGRLDANTTGLLLFTDDGELTQLLICPGNVEKTYVVGWVAPADSGGMSADSLAALRAPGKVRTTPLALPPHYTLTGVSSARPARAGEGRPGP